MNKTFVILTTAGVLALAAVVFGPRAAGRAPAPKGPAPVAAPFVVPAGGAIAAPVQAGADGVVTLSGKSLSPYLLREGGEAYLSLELTAAAREAEKQGPRAPVNLALVIDRSGSMRGEKMEQAKAAALDLVRRLSDDDRLALVDYGSDVRTFESERVGDARGEMLEYVRALHDEGGTFLSGGLQAGAREVMKHASDYRSSRVILISDGQPTSGVTSAQGLGTVAAGIREGGVAVSALGVGTDFDMNVMRTIAEYGGGFSGNVADPSQLAEIFGRELSEATSLVANAVELEIAPAAGVTVTSVAGTPTTRTPEGFTKIRVYDLGSKATARYVVKLSADRVSGDSRALAAVTLRYRDVRAEANREAQVALGTKLTDDEATVTGNADPEVRAALVRAQAAEQMKEVAAAYRSGDTARASYGLANVRKLFGASASALAGSAEVSAGLRQDEAEVQKQIDALQSARSGDDYRRGANAIQSKSIKSFGSSNAY